MRSGRDFLLSTIRTTSFARRRTNSNFSTAAPLHLPKMDSERYTFNPVLRWNPEVERYFIHAYGADHFSRISAALAKPSCYSCIRVNSLKSTSDAVIEKLRGIIGENEIEGDSDEVECGGKASAEKSPLDESWKDGRIAKCKIPGLEYVVLVKGSGPRAVDYGYAPDAPPKEVMVSRKCAEAVLRGAQVYVPGVLACSAHVEKGDTVAVSVGVEQRMADGGWSTGMTRGMVLQGLETGKNDILVSNFDTQEKTFCCRTFDAIFRVSSLIFLHWVVDSYAVTDYFHVIYSDPHYNERRGLYIGQGKSMLSRTGLFRGMEGIAVDLNNRVFKLPSFHDVLEGEIFLQNLPSIVAAHALDPQKGERILDMCAAPGGKTTAIANLMKDEGEVVAADRSHNKVLDIQKLVAELGLTCITTYRLDALKSVCQANESVDSGVLQNSVSMTTDEKQKSSLDQICSDKTCGENGNVFREKEDNSYTSQADVRKKKRQMKNGPGKNQESCRVEKFKGFPPASFDRVLLDAPCSALGLRPRLFAGEDTIVSLRNHGTYQRKMFDQAVKLVRPGGVIVYSTCTLNPGENEALVRYALDTYKFISLAHQHPRIGGPGLVGHYEFPDGYIEKWLKPGEEEFVQRFDPSGPLDTIGFFIAKFAVGSKDNV
ncbi:rRNA (cytosine-C(5))-methyltransferase NOP2C [Linum perenne]